MSKDTYRFDHVHSMNDLYELFKTLEEKERRAKEETVWSIRDVLAQDVESYRDGLNNVVIPLGKMVIDIVNLATYSTLNTITGYDHMSNGELCIFATYKSVNDDIDDDDNELSYYGEQSVGIVLKCEICDILEGHCRVIVDDYHLMPKFVVLPVELGERTLQEI